MSYAQTPPFPFLPQDKQRPSVATKDSHMGLLVLDRKLPGRDLFVLLSAGAMVALWIIHNTYLQYLRKLDQRLHRNVGGAERNKYNGRG